MEDWTTANGLGFPAGKSEDRGARPDGHPFHPVAPLRRYAPAHQTLKEIYWDQLAWAAAAPDRNRDAASESAWPRSCVIAVFPRSMRGGRVLAGIARLQQDHEARLDRSGATWKRVAPHAMATSRSCSPKIDDRVVIANAGIDADLVDIDFLLHFPPDRWFICTWKPAIGATRAADTASAFRNRRRRPVSTSSTSARHLTPNCGTSCRRRYPGAAARLSTDRDGWPDIYVTNSGEGSRNASLPEHARWHVSRHGRGNRPRRSE